MENLLEGLKSAVQTELAIPMVDLTEEYAEIGIDKLLENTAFREIPVVKTIVGLAKGALAIRDFVFARKLAVFFRSFHNGVHSDDELNTLIAELQSDGSKRDRIVEQVIIMNDRYLGEQKSAIHANLLLAHLRHSITWDEFNTLLSSLDNLHPMIIENLRSFKKCDTYKFPGTIGGATNLHALPSVCLAIPHGDGVKVNELGRKFCVYGLT